MSERNYYCLCDDNCKFETMTKEQILAAIAQAAQGSLTFDTSAAFITKVKESNGGKYLTFWVGTQAQYNALVSKEDNCLYIITDNDAPAQLEEAVTASADAVEAVAEARGFLALSARGNGGVTDTLAIDRYNAFAAVNKPQYVAAIDVANLPAGFGGGVRYVFGAGAGSNLVFVVLLGQDTTENGRQGIWVNLQRYGTWKGWAKLQDNAHLETAMSRIETEYIDVDCGYLEPDEEYSQSYALCYAAEIYGKPDVSVWLNSASQYTHIDQQLSAGIPVLVNDDVGGVWYLPLKVKNKSEAQQRPGIVIKRTLVKNGASVT